MSGMPHGMAGLPEPFDRKELAASRAITFPCTIPFAGLQNSTGTLNNRAYVAPVFGQGWVSKIRIRIATQSGNICLAVFDRDGGRYPIDYGSTSLESAYPGRLKLTTGSFACPATGIVDVALPSRIYVDEGDWFGIMADNNTAAFGYVGAGGVSDLFQGLGGFDSTLGGLSVFPQFLKILTSNWESKVYQMTGIR